MRKNLFVCQKGVLTIQFLFGFIIVSGFMVVFALLTLTLVVGEITQYITFSASRSLFLGHTDLEKQKEMAKAKYESLSVDKFKFFSSLSGNSQDQWFKIATPDTVGVGLNNSFDVSSSDPNLFYGVWTSFQAKVLVMDLMFLGKTTEEEEDQAFLVNSIGSYMGREPSQEECIKFTEERWNEIRKIRRQHGPAISSGIERSPGVYESEPDNGC